jgi:putative ABC transport system permease protein
VRRFGFLSRSIWRSLRGGAHLDRAMDEEMRFHIDSEAERLVRERGLEPHEARRLAHVAFGGLEKYKEAGRDTRGLRLLDSLSLDARLGVRMLIKHRGLTLVGGFAMAIAIAIGASFFEVLSEMLTRTLPFAGGDRLVALQIETNRPEQARRVLHDLASWRHDLRSIEHAGAFRTIQQNLAGGTGTPEPVKVAEMSAAGFAITGVPPLIGRYLLPEDERDAAAPVIVLGHQAWTVRFNADPSIVGRSVQLGGVHRTVVGVMPETYRVPLNHHFWIPLRVSPGQYPLGEGPQVYLFGRLASGTTLEGARAEFAAVVGRPSLDGNHGVVRTGRVVPYSRAHVDLTRPGLVSLVQIGRLLVGVLTFVVAVNLAILVYARTVTRRGKIAVRSALGASRRRILAQLFVEAFALTLVGAAGGLLLAKIVLERIQGIAHANGGVPFWIDFDLSAITVIYAVVLAGMAAGIMGVVPGLKATGKGLAVNLHDLGSRAGSRLGPVWTSLVIAQIGAAVAILPAAVYMSWEVVRHELAGVGFAEENFVAATIAFDDGSRRPERMGLAQSTLITRLASEPGVSAVTVSSGVPGFGGDRLAQANEAGAKIVDVSPMEVGVGFFEGYRAEFLGGRSLTTADVGASTVVVSRSFEEVVTDGRSALGLVFRYVPPEGSPDSAATRWYEVVGIVRDFPAFPPPFSEKRQPYVYHAGAPGQVQPAVISLRFDGGIPADVTDRVRRAALAVDPSMQLRRVVSLAAFYDEMRSFWRYVAFGLLLVTTAVLMLSAAGIYALMSFTVAQRTREIGIRMALGAHPRRLLLGIFGRAIRQLLAGVIVGSALSAMLFAGAGFSPSRAAVLLAVVAGLMMLVGVAAAAGPARRSLSVDATEALRADG